MTDISMTDRQAAALVPVVGDVHWINECFPIEPGRHEHVSVYLIMGPEGSIVIDSGSFYHRSSIRARLKSALGPDGLDAIILSHSDYPHSANIGAFRKEWGDLQIVASSGVPAIQGLPYATPCRIGETMEVLGRKFTFVDPPLADRSHTTWIYDHLTGALFTSDGFGNLHRPGECGFVSGEFEDNIRTEDIYDFHREALSWLRYVDPAKLRHRLDEIFCAHQVSRVCPIHGNVVEGRNLAEYLDRLMASVTRIAEGYTPAAV